MEKLEQIIQETPINVSLKILAREIDSLKETPTLKYMKMYPDVQDPIRANIDDAGLDVFAYSEGTWNATSEFYEYQTGLKLQIPKGYWVAIYPRSSISKYDFVLANSVGVVDEGYIGEVLFRFKALSKPTKIYQKGDRIGQIILYKKHNYILEEVKVLENTSRGEGGFGSSGV